METNYSNILIFVIFVFGGKPSQFYIMPRTRTGGWHPVLPVVARKKMPAPAPILALPASVVNRIAAGEVVVSPAAALKELLENALDAGAAHVAVSARGGGARLLRVADDGSGVAEGDLGLLCARHATSKLRALDDLRSVATFGFRGEALASVSHVARVGVVSKVAGEGAWKARYADGGLVEKERVAGVDGTTISVEDMFYNLGTRRRALRAAGEEYRAIVEVVSRYAIKYCGVAFSCRKLGDKAGGGALDVRTEVDASVEGNIRAAFGSAVARELVKLEVAIDDVGVTVSGFVSNAGFSMRKGVFVLFINGRLVNCSPLKRAVDAAYTAYLPKGGRAFVYLDVTMRSSDIDVNVHPNKMEVRFLHEAQLVHAVVGAIEERLKADGKSRTFLAQALITDNGTLARPRLVSPKRAARDMLANSRRAAPAVVGETASGGEENAVRPPAKMSPPVLLASGRGIVTLDAGRDSHGKQMSSKVTLVARPKSANKRRRVGGAGFGALIDNEAIDGAGGRSDDDHDEAAEGEFADFLDDDDEYDGAVEVNAIREIGAGSNTSSPLISKSPSSEPAGRRKYRCSPGSEASSPVVPGKSDGGEVYDDDDVDFIPNDGPAIDLNAQSDDSDSALPPGTAHDSARPSQLLKPTKISSKNKVRTNRLAPVGAMNAFITRGGDSEPSVALDLRKRRQRRAGAPPLLTSVRELIAGMRTNVHSGAAEILREHAFVGVASEKYTLIQYQTKLLLVETAAVVRELMYRQILMRFADLDCRALGETALLTPLVELVVCEDGDGGNGREKARACVEIIIQRAALLDEYFSLVISGTSAEDALLERVPVVFAGVGPDMAAVPEFLVALGAVNWTSEKVCFEGVARVLAKWMGESWVAEGAEGKKENEGSERTGGSAGKDGTTGRDGTKSAATVGEERRTWILRHVLFESMRFDFDPPAEIGTAIREVTSTQKLYRVFERC